MRGHFRERTPGHWAIILDLRDPATASGVASDIASRALTCQPCICPALRLFANMSTARWRTSQWEEGV